MHSSPREIVFTPYTLSAGLAPSERVGLPVLKVTLSGLLRWTRTWVDAAIVEVVDMTAGPTTEVDLLGDEETEETLPSDEQKKANRQLQDHVKKVEAENKDLRGQLIKTHLETLGLNSEAGLGKAIAKEYSGEMTVEAVAEFARAEYGHESATPTETPAPVAQTDRIDALNAGSTAVTPPPQVKPEEVAEQRMHDPNASREDASAAVAAKVGAFVEQHYGPQGPSAPTQ